MLLTQSHQPAEWKYHGFTEKLDPTCPMTMDKFWAEPNELQFRHARHSFAAIIDRLWVRLKPLYVEMHKSGLRPIGCAS